MGVDLARSWLSLEARRRWRALLVLALLVAFATAVVLASVAGARRGASAVSRLAAATQAADATLLPFTSDDAFWAKVRSLSAVAAVATFPGVAFAVDDLPDGRSGMTVPAMDADLFRTIEVPVVLSGRLPDPRRVDEVVVTSLFRATQHKGVGDTVTIRLHTPSRAAGTDRMTNNATPTGPVVRARVVGVVRSAWFAETPGGTGGVISSPALFARYWPNIVGAQKQIPIQGLVRLRPGATFASLRTQLTAAVGSDVDLQDVRSTTLARRQQVDEYEALALLVFAGVAAVAAFVLVGQALARNGRGSVDELSTLRASGLTSRQHALLAAVAPSLAGVLGVAVGVVGAAAASYVLPIGSAALHEPDPGFSFDPLVLGLGGLVLALLVSGGAAASASLAVFLRRPSLGSESLVARFASRVGLAVPVVVGLRFALEPTRAVSVRSALSSAVAGVLGVLAALTFAAGISDASAHPERFGQTQRLEIYLGFGGDPTPPGLLAAIARDPDVAAVNDTRIQIVRTGSATFPAFTYSPSGSPYPTVLSAGRMPERAGELVLGEATAATLGAEVGATITVDGLGPVSMKVTGIGLLPTGLENAYTEGAWVTPAGYDALFPPGKAPSYMWNVAFIALTPDASPADVAARIGALPEAAGRTVGPPAMPPPEVVEIRDIAVLPYLLGGFLALLALGAVAHALTTAVRHRGREVGVLRALGMTRVQSRLVIVVQALVLACVGLLVGVPVGLAVGRLTWHAVALATPIQYVPPSASLALALAAPVTLVLALLLAAYPSRLVGRLRIGHLLRSE